MSEFNDTVRLSELPMLAEGDNWQEMTTLGVDGDGRSVQVPLGAMMGTMADDREAVRAVAGRVDAVEARTVEPLKIEADRSGQQEQSHLEGYGKVAVFDGGSPKNGTAIAGKETAEDMIVIGQPEAMTVRISHKANEGNAGKRQKLEYSTDGGRSWTAIEPTGEETLNQERQAQYEELLAELEEKGHATLDTGHGPVRFDSEEELEVHFAALRDERWDIEVGGTLLLRGENDTAEGWNITTLPGTAKTLTGAARILYEEEDWNSIKESIMSGDSYTLVVKNLKGGCFGQIEVEARGYSEEELAKIVATVSPTPGSYWLLTTAEELAAMWDELGEDVEVAVPFRCGGDVLSLLGAGGDPRQATETPRCFAGLFARSAVAVGPVLPAVLGEGTWAEMYRGCKWLREAGARWSIGDWVTRAKEGIGKTFPTYKWLDGAFKNIDEPVLRLEWEEAAPRLLDEVDATSGKEKASLTGGCMVRPLPTGDVLEKRVDEMQETMSSMGEYLGEMERSVRAGQKIANFWLPKMIYDTENSVVSWNPADNYAGYSVGGKYCTVQEICFWVVGADGLLLGTNGGASFVTGKYQLPKTGPVKRIYAIGVANMSGYDVYTSPVLVYDEGLHSKEEIMSWVGVVFHYKGHKATVADLPAEDNEVGDTWNVRSTGANYAWDGQEWDKLSETVDLSGVAMSADLSAVATSGSYNDLTDKPAIPAAQEQADWNQSNPAAADYIKNKPAIPAAGSQVHQVTAAELAAAQTGGTVTEGDWYFVTDTGSRSLSLGLDATTVQTIWTEQV